MSFLFGFITGAGVIGVAGYLWLYWIFKDTYR